MRKQLFHFTTRAAAGLLAMGIAGMSSAECLLPDVEPVAAAGLVTDFDGNLSCGNISGQFGCTISNGEGSCSGDNGSVFFDVTSTLNSVTGVAEWTVEQTGGEPNRLLGIDTIITDAAQGGNGCLYAFQADAKEGVAGFLKSNGTVALRNLTVCTDGIEELPPPPPPPPVEDIAACHIDANGMGTVAGVTIQCPATDPNFPEANRKTIVVATDTDALGNPVPDKGFQDPSTGEIAFNQFLCVCNPPLEDEVQCNPNLEAGDLPDPVGEYADLEACIIAQDTGSTESIDFTNPTCVTSGGRRRCY